MHNYNQLALDLHKQYQGKIQVNSKFSVDSKDILAQVYTPGVAAVSKHLAEHKDEVSQYTFKGNSVAIISDGSAVLGLGNIGSEGAYPVMEGKALLFKHFANIDGVPILLDTQDTEEIIATIKHIAPTFGGINLEDISAPRCFEIENRLRAELEIPVVHDDQWGTAVVVLAGLINAAKLAQKQLTELKITIVGAGAAGTASAILLKHIGISNTTMVDSKGIISISRQDLDDHKQSLATWTNFEQKSGNLIDALSGSDVFIGVSHADILKPEMIKQMNPDPIIFALANPDPEILPENAKAAGARLIATGRSDYPNQINNALAFPGIFRGMLDNNIKQITLEMQAKAANSLANLVPNLTEEKFIPSIFDQGVMEAVERSFS